MIKFDLSVSDVRFVHVLKSGTADSLLFVRSIISSVSSNSIRSRFGAGSARVGEAGDGGELMATSSSSLDCLVDWYLLMYAFMRSDWVVEISSSQMDR